MTVIIAKDRVLYSDSRKSRAGEIVNDNDVKIITVKDARWKDGDEIIAVAGAGSVKQIDSLMTLVEHKGYEGFVSYNELLKAGLAIPLPNMCLVLVCTKKVYTVRWNSKMHKLTYAVDDHHTIVCEGSGRHSAAIAASLIKTDAIGMMCAAVALTSSCGGYIRSYDTSARKPVIVSTHYKYLRARIIWGMIKVKWEQVKLKFFY